MPSTDEAGDHAAPLLHDERDSDDIELAELNGEDYVGEDYVKVTHNRNDSHGSATVPTQPAGNKWTTYTAVGIALFLTVIGFAVSTEATVYFEDVLEWKKPFCTMYITHSALCLPWLCQLAYLRIRDRKMPYKAWLADYKNSLRESISTVEAFESMSSKPLWKRKGKTCGPLEFLAVMMGIVTVVLTVSGCFYFFALSLTTPADLTAIYNCSTFFAAAFSVPLLKERLGWVSITAVVLSIIGTFVIAYGDTTSEHDADSKIGEFRLVGNMIASVGAVAFGLYEVLFKKWACSSQALPPSASIPLTLAASGLTGIYSFGTLWAGLVVLHFTGVETFVWPSWWVLLWIIIAITVASLAINLLVVIIVWTDPVFGSMANVLAVFVIALSDWFVFGLSPSIATYVGGVVILIAFGMLTKDTLGDKKKA